MCKAITENIPQPITVKTAPLPDLQRLRWSGPMAADPVLGVTDGERLLLEPVESFTDPGVYAVQLDDRVSFFHVERRNCRSFWLASQTCPLGTVHADNEWFAESVLARACARVLRVP